MGVIKKNRRKIIVGGQKFLWYVVNMETTFLYIVSEDKSLVLAVPVSAPKPYAISQGRIFQGKPRSGCWGRYFLPFELPGIITPGIVAQIIEWASQDGSDVSQSWGGDLMY